MPKKGKKTGKKGKVVVDVKYEIQISAIARQSGYIPINIPPLDHNLLDSLLLEKYAKGSYPIVTGDKKMYKENPPEKGATAFISVSNVSQESMEIVLLSLRTLLNNNTARTLAGKRYEISENGETTVFKLEI